MPPPVGLQKLGHVVAPKWGSQGLRAMVYMLAPVGPQKLGHVAVPGWTLKCSEPQGTYLHVVDPEWNPSALRALGYMLAPK